MTTDTPAPVAYLTIPELCRVYDVHRSTVLRWLTVGVDGVRLNGFMIGNRWRIDPADLERFIRAQTAKHLPPQAPPVPRAVDTPAARKRRAAAARKWLDDEGF